jgi:hypothetical protein
MQKATATYVAPIGDNKVVEMGGVTFFDGKSVELNSEEHPHLMSKLAGNPHFDVKMGEDDGKEATPAPKKRGRPSAADRAAAKEAAEAADKAAKEAADKAAAAKADLEATEKAATAPEDGGKQAPQKTRDMKAGIAGTSSLGRALSPLILSRPRSPSRPLTLSRPRARRKCPRPARKSSSRPYPSSTVDWSATPLRLRMPIALMGISMPKWHD